MCSSRAENCADTAVKPNTGFSRLIGNNDDSRYCHNSASPNSVEALRLRSVIEACVQAGFQPTPTAPRRRRGRWKPFHRHSRGSKSEAVARQVAMYLAHVAAGLPYRTAGRLFGRDRTTAAHACAVIEDRRDDPIFDLTMAALEPAVRLSLIQRMPCRTLCKH